MLGRRTLAPRSEPAAGNEAIAGFRRSFGRFAYARRRGIPTTRRADILHTSDPKPFKLACIESGGL